MVLGRFFEGFSKGCLMILGVFVGSFSEKFEKSENFKISKNVQKLFFWIPGGFGGCLA